MEKGKLKKYPVRDFDRICTDWITFKEKTGAVMVGCGAPKDTIGGKDNPSMRLGYKRGNICQFMMLSTEQRLSFNGSFDCDMIQTYRCGRQGKLVISPTILQVVARVKDAKGAMEAAYKTIDDYIEAFYTIMEDPTALKVTVTEQGEAKVKRKANFPLILNERYRKGEAADE